MVEATGVTTLFVIGLLLLYSAGLKSTAGLAALSLPTGAAAFVTAGLLLVSSGSASNPWSTLGMVSVIAAVASMVAQRKVRVPTLRLAKNGACWAGVVGIVLLLTLLLEAVNIASFTPDSFRYITTSSLLRGNGTLDAAPGYLLEDRGFSLPYLHSLAQDQSPGYLASLGPSMAMSGLGILLWIGHGFLSRVRIRPVVRWVLPFAVASAIFTTNRFIFHAFYINGHMVFAVWLLLITASCLVVARRDRPIIEKPLFLAAALATAAIVPLRLEAGVIVGLTLIAASVVTKADKQPAFLLIVLGLVAVTWYGLIVPASYEVAGNAATQSTIGLAIGGGVAGLVGAGRCVFTQHWPRGTLLVLHALFWFILAFFALRDAEPLLSGVKSTVVNLTGPGLWGASFPLLLVLTLAILCTLRFRGMGIVAFPLGSFLPVAFILSYVGGPTYRVAPGDSLNRMWVHFLLLIGLILIAALADQLPWKGGGWQPMSSARAKDGR